MQLADPGEQVAPYARLRVVGGPLVRVLAVDEVGHLLEAGDQEIRERVAVGEPARDRRLVRGGHRERLGGQRAAGLERDHARFAELREDRPVALRSADGRDVGEVLRRRAQHRRAADVDHLDRVLLADALSGDDLVNG